jgi:hypothetical protein
MRRKVRDTDDELQEEEKNSHLQKLDARKN